MKTMAQMVGGEPAFPQRDNFNQPLAHHHFPTIRQLAIHPFRHAINPFDIRTLGVRIYAVPALWSIALLQNGVGAIFLLYEKHT